MRRGLVSGLIRYRKVYGCLALIMLASSLGPSLALAASFYVSAAKADNSLDGSSAANAERDISAGIADAIAAGAGPHVVYVLPGDYTDGSIGSGTGTESFPLIPDNKISVVRQGAAGSVSIRGSNGPGIFLYVTDITDSANTKLDGFFIQNNGGVGVNIRVFNNGDTVSPTIQNNTIQTSSTGIVVTDSTSGNAAPVITNNKLNPSWHGISFWQNYQGNMSAQITNNTITGGNIGIQMYGYTGSPSLNISGGAVTQAAWEGVYTWLQGPVTGSMSITNTVISGNNYNTDFSASSGGSITANLSGVKQNDSTSSDGMYLGAWSGGKVSVAASNGSISNNNDQGVFMSGTSDSQIGLSLSNVDVDGNGSGGIEGYGYNDAGLTLNFNNGSISGNSWAGVYLYGETNAEIKATISQATINGNSSEGVYVYEYSSSVHTDLSISNSTVNSNGSEGVQLYASTSSEIDAKLSNVTIDGNASDGLFISNDSFIRSDTTVTNCTITNNNGYGVYLDNWSNTLDSHLAISSSTISNNSSTGVELSNDSSYQKNDIKISNSVINDNNGYGVGAWTYYDTTVTHLTLTGNSIQSNYNSGIDISGDSGILGLDATGNCVRDNGGDGLYAYGYYGLKFNINLSNNSFTGNTDDGAEISGWYGHQIHATLDRNVFNNNQADGLNLFNWNYWGGDFQASLSGNSISGNTYQGLYVSASTSGSNLLDFGGGSLGSTGKNYIAGNNGGVGNDQAYVGYYWGPIKAENNWWGQNPPSVGNSSTDDIQAYSPIDVDPAYTNPLPLTASVNSGRAGDTVVINVSDAIFMDNVGCGERLMATAGGSALTNLVLSADGMTLTGTLPDNGIAGKGKLVVTNAGGASGSVDFIYRGPQLAADLSQARAYPNPFLPFKGQAFLSLDTIPPGTSVKIYTPLGELVRDLVADANGEAQWDGTNDAGERAASGVYFALLNTGNEKKTIKVAVQR